MIKEKCIIVIGTVIAACGFAGCGSSAESWQEQRQEQGGIATGEEPETRAIGFAATIADDTLRGTRSPGDGEYLLDNELLKETGFGVYCWYNKPGVKYADHKTEHANVWAQYLLMKNQHVTYDALSARSTPWTYSPAKYWPLIPSEMLTLRAYAPYVPYALQTDEYGMPMLPVVVKDDDYHLGRQHDPLWGTNWIPQSANEPWHKYGEVYNDYTYIMSGITDKDYDPLDPGTPNPEVTPADPSNGIIHWYFHHGMAKIMFLGELDDEAPDGEDYTVTSISITPLYNEGMLHLNSKTGNKDEKPTWLDRRPLKEETGMTVTLSGTDLISDVVLIKGTAQALISNGLLIIPREFQADGVPLVITVKYEKSGSPGEYTATASLPIDLQGNTVYDLNLLISPGKPTLHVRLRVNLHWQAGSHFTIEGL